MTRQNSYGWCQKDKWYPADCKCRVEKDGYHKDFDRKEKDKEKDKEYKPQYKKQPCMHCCPKTIWICKPKKEEKKKCDYKKGELYDGYEDKDEYDSYYEEDEYEEDYNDSEDYSDSAFFEK